MNISKELYLNRPLPSGNFPIVIRISHLGKEKIIDTAVYCHRKHWDRFKRAINRHDVAHIIKNNLVDAIYRRIAGKIQDYLDKILADNLELLLNNNDEKVHPDKRVITVDRESENQKPNYPKMEFFSDIIRQKISMTSSLNTRRGYQCLMNYFKSKFGKGPALDDLSIEFIEQFRKKLEEDYPLTSSMRHLHVARLNAVINFGKNNGCISRDCCSKLPSYPLFPSDRSLSENNLREFFHLFNHKLKRDPQIRNNETLSLALFILDIAFQGLAPTDLANLRIRDLNFSILSSGNNTTFDDFGKANHIEIVTIKTLRHKTGSPVYIATALQPISHIIKALTKGKDNDDYLIPCFEKMKTYTIEQRQARLANFFHKMSVSLNAAFHTYYGYRLDRKVTFYFARHAYCNLVDSLDIPHHIIQYLIGHRVTVLEKNYLRRITIAEQVAISCKIFQKLSSVPNLSS